jgi:hypothetical protein
MLQAMSLPAISPATSHTGRPRARAQSPAGRPGWCVQRQAQRVAALNIPVKARPSKTGESDVFNEETVDSLAKGRACNAGDASCSHAFNSRLRPRHTQTSQLPRWKVEDCLHRNHASRGRPRRGKHGVSRRSGSRGARRDSLRGKDRNLSRAAESEELGQTRTCASVGVQGTLRSAPDVQYARQGHHRERRVRLLLASSYPADHRRPLVIRMRSLGYPGVGRVSTTVQY